MAVRMFTDSLALQSLLWVCGEQVYESTGGVWQDAPSQTVMLQVPNNILVCQLVSYAFIKLLSPGIDISTPLRGLLTSDMEQVFTSIFLNPDANMYLTDIVDRVMVEYPFGSTRRLEIIPVVTDGVLLVFHERGQ